MFSILVITATLGMTSATAQNNDIPESTGLPGDNFSLQGAVEMFKKAHSVEEFEQLINTGSNNVNNLDLNNDGETDYVKVIDKADGDVHAFVLQAVVSENENQDIAVIELEKTGSKDAVLQIVGDEDIYGEETIVEPTDENGDLSFINTGNRDMHGPFTNTALSNDNRIVVNVWFWPSVRFVFAPSYVVWVSPWRWHVRPIWWRPWHPVAYTVFYPRRAFYHPHYVVVHTNRIVRARAIYRPVRVTSVTVRTRHQASVTRYRSAKVTRTTVSQKGPRTVTRKTTTVHHTPRGTTVNRKTTTVKRNRRN